MVAIILLCILLVLILGAEVFVGLIFWALRFALYAAALLLALGAFYLLIT